MTVRYGDYHCADPEALETPAMILFQDLMEHNIRSLCDLVGGGGKLMVHTKTHKSEAVARKQVEAGVAGFKCSTLNELAMALEAGARRAILAYPQAQERKVERLCDLTSSHPDAWISATVSTPFHLELLASVAARRRQRLRAVLDLDAGMHRTGIPFGPAAAGLYGEIDANPHVEAGGFHLYDGHDDFTDVTEREKAAQRHIQALQRFQRQMESEGVPVPCIVAGGGYSFPYYARTEGMYGSPGTCVYWDAGYAEVMPDMPFRWAALILTQVVDWCPEEGTVTTDLGSKGVSADLPLEERAFLLGHDSARLIMQHEEHGVFRISGELPRVGDYLLAVPGHICPTTILYPGIAVLDSAGEVVDYYPHTARDRS